MRPARCLKRGGDGARAEGGGIDCPGSARAVTEGYFGIGAPRNEGGEEIHTGVLRSGPIQAAWRTNGRRPRWVASSLSWSARPASASVRPPWRSVTRMNGCSVLSGCARLSVPRHRVPRPACRRAEAEVPSPGNRRPPAKAAACSNRAEGPPPTATRVAGPISGPDSSASSGSRPAPVAGAGIRTNASGAGAGSRPGHPSAGRSRLRRVLGGLAPGVSRSRVTGSLVSKVISPAALASSHS